MLKGDDFSRGQQPIYHVEVGLPHHHIAKNVTNVAAPGCILREIMREQAGLTT